MKQFFIMFFLLFTFQLLAKDTFISSNKKLPTVAIISTGGTISEVTNPKTGASVPASLTDFLKEMEPLKNICNIKSVEFSNIDSSQMTPEIWAKLSETIDKTLKDNKIIGAVVSHGTDTMAEGAYFLELTLKTKKPVVVTGSMRNASDPFSDGPFNLYNAVIQVLSDNAKDWGVTVSLNQYINAARNVIKTNTTNVQTFESGQAGILGYVYGNQVYRINNLIYEQKLPVPKNFPNVYIFQDFPGAKSDVIRFMADQNPAAIVIEALGAGNVNNDVFEGIKYAISKDVLIVITSVVPQGGVFAAYGDVGGGKSLEEAGALFSRYLRADKTRILLLLAIAEFGKNKEKLEKYLLKP